MKYQARLSRELTADELAVYQEFGLGEKVAKLLFIRGIDTREKIEKHFDFSLDRLHDPFLLKGMREAVSRINDAVARREKILIIGDYDADGICAVAILYKYLLSKHVATRYFLPDRDADGYGLNVELVKKLSDRFKPNLLITVDCGISCFQEIEFAKSLGIDCIVTDHHAIPQQVPDCICIDPKFTDQEYPFNELCGAGVSLKLVQALGGIDAAAKYLDICSIATVADIVSLSDENRVIVTRGLEMLNASSLPNVTALAKSCNIWGKITSTDISFKIGPKINASGRMGNAKRGLDILLESDTAEVEKIIQSLNNYNTQRQKLCNTIFDEVDAMVEAEGLLKNNIIIAASERWESGVLGIVSARITEKYGKPSIIFGKSETVCNEDGEVLKMACYKGSSRSIGDINIVKTIELFSDLVLTYGGHSMAAGLSVREDKFTEFVEKITAHMNSSFEKVTLVSEKFYDFEIPFGEISAELVREIEKIEPVGCDNPAPVFMSVVDDMTCAGMNNFPQHLRVTAGAFGADTHLQFIYFNGAPDVDILTARLPKQVVFEFQKLDEGRSEPRAIIKGVMPVLVCDGYSGEDLKLARSLWLGGYLRGRFDLCDGELEKVAGNLSVDRDVFIGYYRAIKSAAAGRGHVSGVYDLFKRVGGEIDLYQFVFCATVFVELRILKFASGRAVVNDKISTDLFKSSAYNMIRNLRVSVGQEEVVLKV